MIIGIDASRANNAQKTGVEWYAFFLIEKLKKIVPSNVQVVLYSEKPLEGELSHLPPNWSSKVLHWPPKRFWTQIRLSYEMVVCAPDVLFIPAHVFPLIHPRKTVMTVHDVAALRFPKSYNSFERWYSLWSARFAAKHLWKIIVPSEFTKQELEVLFGASLQNISLIYHGFDSHYKEKYSEEKKEKILQKYNIQKPFFVSLGRLEEKKNTVRIIKAFDTFCQTNPHISPHLVLIGKPGFLYEQVQIAVEESKYKQNIHELGYVESKDVYAIIQSAQALLFPSLYEGFGIPVLEGFAAHTAVITSSTTSTAEIALNGGYLVDPQNTQQITTAMQSLFEDESVKKDLITKGEVRLQQFSWEKCAQETLDILLSK